MDRRRPAWIYGPLVSGALTLFLLVLVLVSFAIDGTDDVINFPAFVAQSVNSVLLGFLTVVGVAVWRFFERLLRALERIADERSSR